MTGTGAPGLLRALCREQGPAIAVWAVLLTLLSGCGGSDTRAPVEERRGGTSSGVRVYQVQRGDTMYSIAFRYGLDYRRVAAANGLAPPYTIYPGQRIYLREADLAAVQRSAPQAAAANSAASKPAASRPPPAPVAAGTKPVAGNGSVTKSSSTAVNNRPTSTSGRGEPAWRWPSSGRVIRGYSSSVHKGIDLDGARGDPVYAVAPGVVVYSGTGIVGFGELVIVKHNEVYLSAYGHNSRLLVAEGEAVKAGQRIAEKGNTGTDKVKLHFEIRREGKPVDPTRLLPRR